MPLRLRYAQSLSFAYQSLAGALTLHRPAGDADSLDQAFQVMERLRARGLMETLLADVRPAIGSDARPRAGPGQARLDPKEALLSFQIWRPEPMMDAPYREGSSWVTVVTRTRVDAFPVPNADVLESQIRAWTGLLERRDGSDRAAGARLSKELLAATLAVLPPGTDRLVIVPDGPLHRLPFDALSDGPDTPYLAERFSVSILHRPVIPGRHQDSAPRSGCNRTRNTLPSFFVTARPRGRLRDSTGVFASLCMRAGRPSRLAARFRPGASCGPRAGPGPSWSAPLDGVSLLHLATTRSSTSAIRARGVVLAPGSGSGRPAEPRRSSAASGGQWCSRGARPRRDRCSGVRE
jgi:hypothetical protein